MCQRAPFQLECHTTQAFTHFWDGLFGIFPGSASSNNSLEARHSDWQKELQSLGPPFQLDGRLAPLAAAILSVA